jgi:hypothetical protein
MARQDGNHPFVGRIGDLIYYKRNGKYFVRKAGNPSKEKIKTAPEFEKTRNLNSEFGGCVKVGHDLREAIGSLLPNHSDKDITGRLVGLFSKVIKKGSGECGARMLELKKNRELIKDFQFHKDICFDKVFNEYIHYNTSDNRKEITLFVDAFNPLISLIKLGGVTHFRLFLGVVAFSDFEFNKTSKTYHPVNTAIHETFNVSFSEFIVIANKCKGVSMTSSLLIKEDIPESIGIIAVVGIEFFKEENNVMYNMATKNCMKIGEVF